MPVLSDSPEALQSSLSGLRGQLAKAQRKDPKLHEIMEHLKRKPAGSYLAEPRADIKRVKARALQYPLAANGLFVVKTEGSDRTEDRPCVARQL